ncbi:MAG: DNA primase [Parcubacteria group bacterium]|jgi:DNA primase
MASGDVEEIKTRLNIVDVLRDYIRLEKAGANYRALCPFHNEKSPSFMVNEDKQMWHCFGCQKGGDVFAFVMEIEGLEFKDALKQLAEKAGVELQKVNPKLAAEKNKTLEILELATKFYETQLWAGEGKVKIINYLKERGLRDEIIKDFRLGYAPPGWRNLLTFLEGRGYTAEEVVKTGLIIKKDSTNQKLQTANLPAGRQDQYYDRFRDRVMFPIADTNKKIVGYSARVAPGGDESQAKYVNTPETEVYHKSKILYGIDKAKQAMRQEDFVLLVEGNMDVIASSQAGLKNTVAVSGTALTLEQVAIIKRYTSKIKMFFDMDSAGEAATKKSIKLCFVQDVAVQVVTLPAGKDAAELAQKDPAQLLAAVAQAKDAMEYFFEKIFSKYDKNKVEDKKIIAAELLDMISNIASAIGKSHWLKELSGELNTSEAVLTDMLKQANLKERVTNKSSNSVTEKAYVPREKVATLTEDLIGLMLVSSDVWKLVTEKAPNNALFLKDSLLNFLVQNGGAVHYSLDDFLKSSASREIKEKVEKIYFEKKYFVGLNNDLEETVIAHPLAEAEQCLKELQRESKKQELEKISSDMKLAEKQGDKVAAKFLRGQCKQILEDLTQLAN